MLVRATTRYVSATTVTLAAQYGKMKKLHLTKKNFFVKLTFSRKMLLSRK